MSGPTKPDRPPADLQPARPEVQREESRDHETVGRDALDPSESLDPSMRHVAQLAPPMATTLATPASDPTEPSRRGSLEQLLPALVRRIAWGGDARRGSVRIEIGAGELAGGTLVVHADDGRVRVELCVPSGVDASAWRDRIEQRLSARGLDVDSIDVTRSTSPR